MDTVCSTKPCVRTNTVGSRSGMKRSIVDIAEDDEDDEITSTGSSRTKVLQQDNGNLLVKQNGHFPIACKFNHPDCEVTGIVMSLFNVGVTLKIKNQARNQAISECTLPNCCHKMFNVPDALFELKETNYDSSRQIKWDSEAQPGSMQKGGNFFTHVRRHFSKCHTANDNELPAFFKKKYNNSSNKK